MVLVFCMTVGSVHALSSLRSADLDWHLKSPSPAHPLALPPPVDKTERRQLLFRSTTRPKCYCFMSGNREIPLDSLFEANRRRDSDGNQARGRSIARSLGREN